jgi:hypothetical protein
MMLTKLEQLMRIHHQPKPSSRCLLISNLHISLLKESISTEKPNALTNKIWCSIFHAKFCHLATKKKFSMTDKKDICEENASDFEEKSSEVNMFRQ